MLGFYRAQRAYLVQPVGSAARKNHAADAGQFRRDLQEHWRANE